MVNDITFVEIDKSAVYHNLFLLRKIAKGKEIIAMIKNYGYGHGLLEMAGILSEFGVECFGVNTIEEAIELRIAGFNQKIMVFGVVDPQQIYLSPYYDVVVTIPDVIWLQEVTKELYKSGGDIEVQINLDSGFNRIGVIDEVEINKILTILKENKKLKLVGVFSQFIAAGIEKELTLTQVSRFNNIVEKTNEHELDYIHIHNTPALLSDINVKKTTHVRIGLGIYGISPFNIKDGYRIPWHNNLIPVLSWKTRLIQVKLFEKGEIIGFDGTYKIEEPEYIGIIPVGYGHGLAKGNTGRSVYIGDTKCEIIGDIGMDNALIKLPYFIPVGSDVELIGKNISVYDVANHNNTSPYEILTAISISFKRIIK